MPRFTHHLFVCCNQREPDNRRGCCDCDGSERLRAALKTALHERGLKGTIRANAAGCLDQCEMGPIVVIYPEGIWYGGVREEDVPRIVEQTLVCGEVLHDLQIPEEALNTKGVHPWRREGPEDQST